MKTLMALQLVNATHPVRRDTFQVVIFPKEEDKDAVWTSQYFTSRRAAKQHLARLRLLFKEMHLWQFFGAHYDMSVEANQGTR